MVAAWATLIRAWLTVETISNPMEGAIVFAQLSGLTATMVQSLMLKLSLLATFILETTTPDVQLY